MKNRGIEKKIKIFLKVVVKFLKENSCKKMNENFVFHQFLFGIIFNYLMPESRGFGKFDILWLVLQPEKISGISQNRRSKLNNLCP